MAAIRPEGEYVGPSNMRFGGTPMPKKSIWVLTLAPWLCTASVSFR